MSEAMSLTPAEWRGRSQPLLFMIHTVKYINLSDISACVGEDLESFSERLSDFYTWGDTDIVLVNLSGVLRVLNISEEENVMEALWDIIGTTPEDASKYFVNLTS